MATQLSDYVATQLINISGSVATRLRSDMAT